MDLQYSFPQSATLGEQACMESSTTTTSGLSEEGPRDEAFKALVARVRACRLCPRMDGRIRVLGYGNGNIHTSVLFVAEAPGRLGADRWEIPLFGDQTGRNFEALLQEAKLDRYAVFITNAVLCNPRDEFDRNATPTRQEVANCSSHLRETIAIIKPRYVVALGQVALQALNLVAPHEVQLSHNVGQLIHWHGRWLVALYHPGPRARVHRPLALQVEDYRRLGLLIRSDANAH